MISWRYLVLLGSVAAPFAGCGPDQRPEGPCDGPSFNLVVGTETGPLPEDTRINVRYGGNQDGEPYVLGERRTPQAVFCAEDTSEGGASASEEQHGAAGAGAGAGAAPVHGHEPVQRLRCRLYTQGPARLDVTATGYVPIEDLALSLDSKHRCQVEFPVRLMPLLDAGM